MALNENYQEAESRVGLKEEKSDKSKKRVQRRKARIRLFPIWLRVVIVSVLIILSVFSGAAVGYGVLGNGKASDVFKPSTWTHIIDLVDRQ